MTTGALSALALTWSAAFASTAMWAALRSKRAARSTSEPVARATLIRPCAGDEPALARALGSTALAARSFPMAVRFAVASLTDTATPAAEAARGQLRASGLDAEVVVTGARGPNRKADQLARTLDREPCAPIVIVADSDVDLTGLPLDDLVAALASPGVGAVWATPIEVAASTGADRASAAVLDASLHAFPLLAALDPRGVVGKLFAVRADDADPACITFDHRRPAAALRERRRDERGDHRPQPRGSEASPELHVLAQVRDQLAKLSSSATSPALASW